MEPTTKRKVVAIAFMGVGAFILFKGRMEDAAIFYGIAIAYWVVSGLWVRLAAARRPERPPRPREKEAPPAPVAITADAARSGRSDGAAGAAARLDPMWRDWLRREAGGRQPSR